MSILNLLKTNIRRITEIFILVFSVILTLALSGKLYFDTLNNNSGWVIFASALLLLILSITKIVLEIKGENLQLKVIKLQEENQFYSDLIGSFKYQISEPLENKLCEVYKKLGFDNKYRITVYTHTTDRFFSIGRYSKNENFRKFGRIAIRDKNELLFKAWNNGELLENISPDSRRKMPSKKIAINYLYEKNEQHPDKNKFGVVVFETTNGRDSKLKDDNLQEHVQTINEFFHNSWNIKQDLSFATSEGL
ncbi:hypothetical protein QIW31_07635 [Francisellaceae bacterium CB299]